HRAEGHPQRAIDDADRAERSGPESQGPGNVRHRQSAERFFCFRSPKDFAMKRNVLLGLFLSCLSCVFACSRRPDPPPATLEELEKVTAAKSAHEIATYIFDNYGCKNCHTVASAGKFGYTALGEQLKNKSEGCISMLTSVSRIVTLPETSRTPENQEKLAHFKD